MKASDFYRSEYLRAADLNGQNVPMIIDRVEAKEVGQEKREKLVVFFRGQDRSLVLNATNNNTITDEYGDSTDEWLGKPVILFATKVDYQGKRTDAIRIRIVKQDVNAPLDDEIPFQM